MDDSTPRVPPEAEPAPPAVPPAPQQRLMAWSLTLWTVAISTFLIFIVNTVLPWPRPGGAYGAIGLGMLLPFLLIGGAVAVGFAATAVFVVARVRGLGGWPTAGCMLLASLLAIVAFVAGFDRPGA
ncbi:MAG: hypothetical protein GAK31_00336 [Stenotrophomonas maltophilia]|uniref:Transmembrane protein n=1 Tax=Stenotrophomonas maltophilia TaxID=40324 RepID=A0A7V8FJE2_STEMA|nr:MAG: hypothetical protein GAK31_00336 [Stenotrophomonas maltophilia]